MRMHHGSRSRARTRLRALLTGSVVIAGVAFTALASPGAQAQEFKLAMSSPPTSMDSHFDNLFPNLNVSDHIFETLVTMAEHSHMTPGLAQSWTLINNLAWEFKLRPGVKFHDGSELTTEGIAWSMERPSTIVGSPGKFDVHTKAIINKKIIDANTIRFTARKPYPIKGCDAPDRGVGRT